MGKKIHPEEKKKKILGVIMNAGDECILTQEPPVKGDWVLVYEEEADYPYIVEKF